MRASCCVLLLFLAIHQGRAQLASMMEGTLQVLYKKEIAEYDTLISRKRSPRCNWSAWGPCLWAKADARSRGSKYMDQLPQSCKQHWFFDLINRTYRDAVNNVFDYVAKTVNDEEPCGFCSYRQSCGYGGPDKCDQRYRGNRPSIIPLHVGEQICQTGRGLTQPQDGACEARRSVLELNNPRSPCQIWPAVEQNLRLPGIPNVIKSKLASIKWVRCVPDRGSKYTRLTNPRSPLKGRMFPSSCRCCCFPYEPKLVPTRVGNKVVKVYKCRRIEMSPYKIAAAAAPKKKPSSSKRNRPFV